MVSGEAKIISPKGQILKAMSQKFSQKKTKIIGKVNSKSGQISLCTIFSVLESQSLINNSQIIKLFQYSIHSQQNLIEDIINLIQNNQQNVDPQSSELKAHGFIKLCAKHSQKQRKLFAPIQQFQKRKQHKCKSYGVKFNKAQVNSLSKYLAKPLDAIDQMWQDERTIHNFKRQVKEVMSTVENSLVRQNQNLKNFQRVQLPQRNYENIVSQIKIMKKNRKSKHTAKIQRSGIGSLTVHINIARPSKVFRTYKYLETLPQQFELSFVNNYFSCNQLQIQDDGKDVIIQLALRRQELLDYLQNNSKCISFASKMRILSQLMSATYLLQTKCNTMMSQMGIADFSMSKNLMLKLNQVQNLQKFIDKQKANFQKELKLKSVQAQVNISRIYTQLFYQKDIMYVKPSKNSSRLRLSHVYQNSKFEQKQVVIDKIYQQCGFHGPKKIMGLLTCIFVPYIPMISLQQIKSQPPCKSLKWGIASLVKVLQTSN